MEQKIRLRPETVEKINKLDQSVVFWSVQLGKATLNLREIEGQLQNIYNFKKSAVLEDLKSREDLDIEHSDIVTIDAETVSVTTPDKPESK